MMMHELKEQVGGIFADIFGDSLTENELSVLVEACIYCLEKERQNNQLAFVQMPTAAVGPLFQDPQS